MATARELENLFKALTPKGRRRLLSAVEYPVEHEFTVAARGGKPLIKRGLIKRVGMSVDAWSPRLLYVVTDLGRQVAAVPTWGFPRGRATHPVEKAK